MDMGLQFVGCYGAERQLGKDKIYGGGSTGANIGAALQLALEHDKRFIALSRMNHDGHAFAFNDAPDGEGMLPKARCQPSGPRARSWTTHPRSHPCPARARAFTIKWN